MSTMFLIWGMLITSSYLGADHKVEGICLGFFFFFFLSPVLAFFYLFMHLLKTIHVDFISCMLVSMSKHMKSSPHNREITQCAWMFSLTQVKAHVGERWRRLRRRRKRKRKRRGPWREDRAAGPCVM